jgi:GntR family transcriptional regulator
MSSVYVRKSKPDTRTQSVYNRLRQLAYDKGPDGKLPTTRELCGSLRASRTTLDGALNSLEAERIIYRRQGSGIYVSPKIGYKSIAVLFSHKSDVRFVSSPFWGMLQDMLMRGALERAQHLKHEYSFHLLPFNAPRESSDARKSFEDLIVSGNLDGILCVQPDGILQELMRTAGLPIVGYALGPMTGWGVANDIVQLVREAIGQLTRQGCRRIVLIPAHNVQWDDYAEIVKICESVDPPISSFTENSLDSLRDMPAIHQYLGNLIANEVFGRPDSSRPDGLIVLDDMVADGIIKALFNMGIRPGLDIRIATHGNTDSPILCGWESQLTIIESDPARIADTMFEILDSILLGDPPQPGIRHLPWTVRVHGAALPEE